MKKSLAVVSVILTMLPLASFADKTILCDPPQGTRIDYFSYNSINLQNETFLMGKDRISGMKPKIVLSANNKDVSFFIGDASEAKSATKSAMMKVLEYDEDQISFTGLVNNAPILATYYPKIAILIYSQQSVWPGPDYKGARAAIFYSRCAQA